MVIHNGKFKLINQTRFLNVKPLCFSLLSIPTSYFNKTSEQFHKQIQF